MNNSIDIFGSAWLRGISDTQLRRLTAITEFVDFGRDETIYAASGPQESLWGVKTGEVRVHVALNEEEPILGHIHHPGAWFGETELIQGIDGLVEMRSGKVARLAKVSFNRFRKLAYDEPAYWEAFAKLTSFNQVLAMSAANDLVLRTSKLRLAATLLRLSGRRGVLQGSSVTDDVQVNQRELARLANIAPSKASVHLGALAESGFIQLRYGCVRLLDPAGLSGIIGG